MGIVKNIGKSFCLGCAILSLVIVVGCNYEADFEIEDPPLVATALDVGQGLAVLLEWQGRFALYDMGPDSVGVLDSLAARGIDTLEWVVLSHYHRDHVGGFLELPVEGKPGYSRIGIRQIFVGTDTSGGFIRDSIVKLSRRLDIMVDTLIRGKTLELGTSDYNQERAPAGPRLETLWPSRSTVVGENGASVVLRLEYGMGSILLTGDLDSLGERRLLDLSPTLSADLLQVGHHGSAGSSTLKFLAQVNPKRAFISVGASNRYGHPTAVVLNKLTYVMEDSSSISRTDLDGSVSYRLFPGMGVLKDGIIP